MPTFEISMLAGAPMSASVELSARDEAEAVRLGLMMHSHAQVVWTKGSQSVGPYIGPVKKAWAVRTSGTLYRVSMLADVPLSAIENVVAPDEASAVREARRLNGQSQAPWQYRGVGIKYSDEVDRLWTKQLPDAPPPAPDAETSTSLSMTPSSVAGYGETVVMTARVSSGRGVPTGYVAFTMAGSPATYLAPLSGGVAVLNYGDGWPVTASVTVTAHYVGDGPYLPSTASGAENFVGTPHVIDVHASDSVAAHDSPSAMPDPVRASDSVAALDQVSTALMRIVNSAVSDSAATQDGVTVVLL